MNSFQVRTGYDRLYETTRMEAAAWSPIRLTISLNLIMPYGVRSEDWWGAIDAITDLLGKISPPVWREELREGVD